MNSNRVGQAVASGVTFLAHSQASDGSFDTYCSPTAQPFTPGKPYRTTFLPAVLLGALADVEQAKEVCKRLAAWLQAQAGPETAFNYWPQDAPGRTSTPYPDDLDDTFCALSGLWRYNPKLVGPEILGKAVRLLLATETKVGGPYRTWLVPPTSHPVWLDVDLAVNANVAYFLRLIAQPLPNLDRFLEQAIRKSSFVSPYYPSAYPLLYYIGRAYRGGASAKLVQHILALRTAEGHWETPLQTALALQALHEQGNMPDASEAIDYLLATQTADGSWPAEPFWLEVQHEYSGSRPLSTALIVQALSAQLASTAAASPSKAQAAAGEALYTRVVQTATGQCAQLPPTLRSQARGTLQRMIAGDHNREIILLPYFFMQSLQQGEIAQSALVDLGLANIYGWTAYTLHDDFLDNAGDVRFLPLANMFLRTSVHTFQRAVPNTPEYQAMVEATFTIIDNANAWEVTHCRFAVAGQRLHIGSLPNYGKLNQLAERSLGHALTPLGVLALLGIPPGSKQAQAVLRALKAYLMARQLGDDLCDWETDVRAGHCSAVVAEILHGLGVKPGTHNLASLIPAMQQQFTKVTLPAISERILQYTARSQRALRASRLVTPHSPVTQLIEAIAARARAQLRSQAEAQAFLKAYRQP